MTLTIDEALDAQADEAIRAFFGASEEMWVKRVDVLRPFGEPLWAVPVEGGEIYASYNGYLRTFLWCHEVPPGVAVARQRYWTYHPLALPEARHFEDLFPEWTTDKERGSRLGTKGGPRTIPISAFCSTSHVNGATSALYVRARGAVIDWIHGNMLFAGDNDSIYFELIERDDGVLVVAKNNTILASRWLALIESESLPFRSGVQV